MKLSKRLKQIKAMVTHEYDHIWDCCCDHGFLGASLLQQTKTSQVHFVDIVPELIERIDNNLQRASTLPTSRWTTHCCNVAELPLTRYRGTHLVIIAGVSGHLTAHFVSTIYQQYPTKNIRFILCPAQQPFELRKTLIRLNVHLESEKLIEENQRFYEILRVSRASNAPASQCHVSQAGEFIWQASTEQQKDSAKRYLDNRLNYYRQAQLQNTAEINESMEAYQHVGKTFFYFN